MKKLFFCTAACLLCVPAIGQNVTYDAYKLAEILAASGWQSVEQSLPTLVAGIESQLRSGGATEKAAKTLSEQVRLNITRDNITKVLAQGLTEKMTVDELKTLNEFMQSPLGQKYLSFSAELSTKPTYMLPLLKKSCDAASQQLDAFERGSINSVCSKL